MMKYEIKKVFAKTSSKIAVLLLFLVMGITCFFALSVSWVDESGTSRSGPVAISSLKSAQKEWSGYLDEETIRTVIAENKRIQTSPEALSQNVTENNIAYGWLQGIKEIRELLNCSYADSFRDYDYYRADSLTKDDAASFYDNRIRLLREWLGGEAENQFSDEEKAYLIRQYERLDTPLLYDYMTGWRQLFEFAPTVVMLTMLILGYLVSGIFSCEFAWKSDAVFFSSVYGRDRAIRAKIRAGFCIVTAIYFAAFLLYSGIVLLYYGADGWMLPVQVSWGSWKCLYSITNLQKYFLIGIGGYIGCLFISFLSMLVSAKTKSSVLAVMVPVLLVFIPSFFLNLNSFLVNKIIALLPDQLLQTGTALDRFDLYSIGTFVVGAVQITLPLYAALTAVLLPVLYRIYRRQQIYG